MPKKNKHTGKIAVVASNFNNEIADGLLKGALQTFKDNGFKDSAVTVIRCPGAFEIPFVAKKLCESERYSVVLCLGAVIKGETAHFEYISETVSNGIAQLNLEYDIPVIFGVLTCYTYEQAVTRSGNNSENKGSEAALAAIEMMSLKI
jgi:6,7-dimethyl-8-ribityllumazine synthase